jgi:hypothetical protein
MKAKVILSVLLALSVSLNLFLLWAVHYDEGQITQANAERVKFFNDYRDKLIKLKADHPIMFRDLEIPDPVQ